MISIIQAPSVPAVFPLEDAHWQEAFYQMVVRLHPAPSARDLVVKSTDRNRRESAEIGIGALGKISESWRAHRQSPPP